MSHGHTFKEFDAIDGYFALISDAEGKLIAKAFSPEKTLRIIACLDACAGMNNAEVSRGLTSTNHYSTVVHQRDELLALLSRLVPLLELDDEHAVTGIFSSQTRGAIEEARAFITKPAFDPSALPDDDPRALAADYYRDQRIVDTLPCLAAWEQH